MLIMYNENNEIVFTMNPTPEPFGIEMLLYQYENCKYILVNDDINIDEYKIENNKLVKMNSNELVEYNKYGKLLSIEERNVIKMKPTDIEIKDAEEEIKLLKLLEELI